MKKYILSRFGTAHVLTNQQTGDRTTLKSFEGLTHHINRFRMANEVEGLDQIPQFHLNQIQHLGQ